MQAFIVTFDIARAIFLSTRVFGRCVGIAHFQMSKSELIIVSTDLAGVNFPHVELMSSTFVPLHAFELNVDYTPARLGRGLVNLGALVP